MESVCIGVDVGGTNLRFAMVTPGGVVLRRESQGTDIVSGAASFLSRLLMVLGRLQNEAELDGRRLVAVGLGVPGLISKEGILNSSVNLQPLQGLDLAAAVSSRLGLPVVALNDANASALGEHRFGAARPYRSSLVLTLGTGVGAGLILDGRLWTGVDGTAGEFGHITVEPNGRPCGCGNRGCLEQYASATAIAASGRRQTPEEGYLAAADLAARAFSGSAEAAAIFEQAGTCLGIAAAGALNLLNLEAIILGGGVAGSFELLAPAMRREILARAFAIPGERVRILKSELGDDAGVLGCAAAAFEIREAGWSAK